eukprot:COSAG02_NODE_2311_length_9167_cov_20.835024_2_plen_46_part_00
MPGNLHAPGEEQDISLRAFVSSMSVSRQTRLRIAQDANGEDSHLF